MAVRFLRFGSDTYEMLIFLSLLGTHITVYKNGAPICTSKANYGRKASTREPAGSAHGGMLHISETSACRDFGEVEKGDVLTITAFYDAIKYPQMVHGGELHPVMGISLITVEPKPAFAV